MRKKIALKITAIVLTLTCNLLIFNPIAVANHNNPASLTIDDITIYPQYGFVEDTIGQLTAILSPESAYQSLVEWSSSNPSVISCTEDGVIEGVSPGGYADITCKAKYGSAEDTIRIYCVKSIGTYQKNEFNNLITLIYAQPSAGKISTIFFNVNYFFEFLRNLLMVPNTNGIFSLASATLNAYKSDAQRAGGTSCEVRGKYGSYAYVAVETPSGGADGFVKYTKLKNDIKGFLSLSAKDINVWGDGIADTRKKLTSSYKGDVKWFVGDDTIIEFDESTGQITGLKPGTTTITAKADGVTRTCTVHSLYKWPQSWIGKANQNTSLYKAEGSGYKTDKTIKEGTDFIVYGDDATDNGWAYGNIDGTDDWGYIPISSISTKGTISQYNNMTTTLNGKKVPLAWPMYDESISFISSPYGPRSKTNGGDHKGFDITTGIPGEIEGCPVVATFSGTIKKIYIDNEKETAHGNAIVITTDSLDPITGKNLTIIYMHLSKWNTNSSGSIIVEGEVLKEGDSVTINQIIGFAGNTGKNTSGAHLHYEVNNQNAAIRSGSKNPFTETINPIYFYMDKEVEKCTKCEAASNGNGFYWYGENE